MDLSAALLAESGAFADLVAGADWESEVPTCPGWTVLQLVRHVGRGHRWAAQMVAERAETPLDPRKVRDGRPPDDRGGALAWLRASGSLVVAAVERAGPDIPVWTFTGTKPATWWVRRRLHESAVHRADAALALGAAYETTDDLAADGVAEWLHLMAARPRGEDRTAPVAVGTTLALATDHGAAWVLRGTEAGLGVEPGTGPADCTVTAPAADLLLAVTRRRHDVRVAGDAGVWRAWLEATTF